MSRAVSDHLTWFVHSQGLTIVPTKRAGASNQRLVLLNYCAHVDRAGVAWPSQARQASVLGISRQTVQDCRQALEEQGYLERVSKNTKPGALVRYRVLPSVLADLFAREPDGQPDGQPDGRPDGLARAEGEGEGNSPPTPRTAQRRERDKTPEGGGKEGGGRRAEVLAGCIEAERKRTRTEVGTGLVRKWEREYAPIVAKELLALPGRDNAELVKRCVALRNGEQVKAPAPRVDPDCPDCHGKGVLPQVATFTERGWEAQPPIPCPCTTPGNTPQKSDTRASA